MVIYQTELPRTPYYTTFIVDKLGDNLLQDDFANNCVYLLLYFNKYVKTNTNSLKCYFIELGLLYCNL